VTCAHDPAVVAKPVDTVFPVGEVNAVSDRVIDPPVPLVPLLLLPLLALLLLLPLLALLLPPLPSELVVVVSEPELQPAMVRAPRREKARWYGWALRMSAPGRVRSSRAD